MLKALPGRVDVEDVQKKKNKKTKKRTEQKEKNNESNYNNVTDENNGTTNISILYIHTGYRKKILETYFLPVIKIPFHSTSLQY